MRHPAKFPMLSMTACFAVSLAACGGGGGGSAPAAASYDLQAGYVNRANAGLKANVTLSGTALVNGVSTPFTGTGTLIVAPAASATFNSSPALAQVEVISGTVTAAGQFAPYSAVVTHYYAPGSYAVLGESTSSEYDVVPVPFNYPASLITDPSGVLGTMNRYTDSSMGVSLGTAQLSYAVTLAPVDPGSPLQVQLTKKIFDAQNALTETDVTTYALTANNQLSFVSATVQTSSGTVTITAQ